MSPRDEEIIGLCTRAGVPELAVLVDTDVVLPDVRRLVLYVTARISDAPDYGGVMPALGVLDEYPPVVRDIARNLILRAIADAMPIRTDH